MLAREVSHLPRLVFALLLGEYLSCLQLPRLAKASRGLGTRRELGFVAGVLRLRQRGFALSHKLPLDLVQDGTNGPRFQCS